MRHDTDVSSGFPHHQMCDLGKDRETQASPALCQEQPAPHASHPPLRAPATPRGHSGARRPWAAVTLFTDPLSRGGACTGRGQASLVESVPTGPDSTLL